MPLLDHIFAMSQLLGLACLRGSALWVRGRLFATRPGSGHDTYILSTMFFYMLNSVIFHGVLLGEFWQMGNLQYNDDLLVLTLGNMEDLKIIKLILFLFEAMSRLTINFSKTCLYSTKADRLPEAELAQMLGCTIGLLPFTYLGLPIFER